MQSSTEKPLKQPAAELPPKQPVTLRVNGVERSVAIRPWTTLLDALREYLDVTGTKKGCDHGQCGACTVLVDGRRVVSCLTLAVMKDGAEITTIEGLANHIMGSWAVDAAGRRPARMTAVDAASPYMMVPTPTLTEGIVMRTRLCTKGREDGKSRIGVFTATRR